MRVESEHPSRPRAVRRPEDVTHVRGVVAQVVCRVLREGLPEEGWAPLVAQLSPRCRDLLTRTPDAYEWVPIRLIGEAVEVFARSGGDANAALRGGIYADQMVTRSHQWMLKVMTPDLLLRQCPRMFAFYHQGGLVAVDALEPGSGCLSLRASGPGPDWFKVLLPTWFQRALELCGAAGVEVVHEWPSEPEEPFRHRYHIRWREGGELGSNQGGVQGCLGFLPGSHGVGQFLL